MKIKETYVLYGILMIVLFISTVQLYHKDNTITRLETTITEQEKTIEELTNQNELAKENCSKIVKGYAMSMYDFEEIVSDIDEYFITPDLFLTKVQIITSRTERFMERKNILLEEMDIDVDTLRAEINEIIEMREN